MFKILQVGSLGIWEHLAYAERKVFLKLKKKFTLKSSIHILKVSSSLSPDILSKAMLFILLNPCMLTELTMWEVFAS